MLKKESKGWQNDVRQRNLAKHSNLYCSRQLSNSKFNDARERNRFCIEVSCCPCRFTSCIHFYLGPFRNRFQCCTMRYQGWFISGTCRSQRLADSHVYLTRQIRGEFMRASRILAMRPRAILALSQLCEEKTGSASPAPPPSLFVPPRLTLPPQGSFSAGTSPMQSRGVSSERHSPKPEFFDPGRRTTAEHRMPEHMAPKRSQWTSPPPPEASPEHHAMFQDQLDQGIALATTSTFASECAASTTSGDSLEILNDEESRSEATGSDDLQSTRSFAEGSLGEPPSIPVTMVAQPFRSRGRLTSRPVDPPDDLTLRTITDREAEMTSQKADLIRRSQSGPPGRKATNRFSWPSATYPAPILFQTSPSLRPHQLHVQIPPQATDASTVFYETTATRSHIPQPFPNTQEHTVNVTLSTYPTSGSQPSISTYHLRTHELGESLEHDLSAIHLSDRGFSGDGMTGLTGSPLLSYSHTSSSHRHIPSVVTTTPHPDHFSRSNSQSQSPSSSPTFAQLAQRHLNISSGRMKSRSPSRSPLRTNVLEIPGGMEMNMNLASYPYPAPYVNYPSTPSSISVSPSSPTTREEPPCYSSPQLPMPMPVKLGSQSGLKAAMNLGQPHTRSTAPGSVNLARSARSVTPLR